MNQQTKNLQRLAGILSEAIEEGDRVKVVYGNEFYGETGTVEEVRGGFVLVSIDGEDGEYSMHISDVEKIEDEDDEYNDYEDLEEAEFNKMIDPELLDDVPSVELFINDNGLMRIKLSAFYHTKDNGKVPLLKDNPALQNVVMKAIQIEAQKAFRKAVHGVLGIPYGLK